MVKQRNKRRKLTSWSIAGTLMGFSLVCAGLYYGLAQDRPGGYFVVFLGLVFNVLIYLTHKD